ncbi:hypothetical protein AK812_SmicGene22550, partial [Symbiodinium microadriaticum]
DFTTLISAYGAVGKWRFRFLLVDVSGDFTTLISAYGAVGKWRAGTFGYSAVIRALGRKQQWS